MTNSETPRILNQLHNLVNKKKCLKLNTFNFEIGDHKVEVNKWKFYNSYYSLKNHVTLARSIFTYKVLKCGNEHLVFARGYDKFTDFAKLKKDKLDLLNSAKKFELTVKENGCLLMASVITYNNHSKLIISSKNVLGIENQSAHAEYGEKALDKCLKGSNRSKKELIDYITEENVTLLFELCDDNFEEHILPYKEDSGLYLHGINKNYLSTFESYSFSEVSKIAQKFGFKKPECTVYENTSISEILKTTDLTKGIYNGRVIEGFVLRTNLNNKEKNIIDFMVKFKFDYPYLMYREWRELTKEYIKNQKTDSKIRFTESYDYLEWLKNEYSRNKGFFEGYMENRGIVKAREKYLLSKQSTCS